MPEGLSPHPSEHDEQLASIRNARSFGELKKALGGEYHPIETGAANEHIAVAEAEVHHTTLEEPVKNHEHGPALEQAARNLEEDIERPKEPLRGVASELYDATLALQQETNPDQRNTLHDEVIVPLIQDLKVELGKHNYDSEQLAASLRALAHLEQATNGYNLGWTTLENVPEELLRETAKSRNTDLEQIMRNGADAVSNPLSNDPEYYATHIQTNKRFLNIAAHAYDEQYGPPEIWINAGDLQGPPALEKLIKSPDFTATCMERAIENAEKFPSQERDKALRLFERRMLENHIGLSQEFAEDFRLAFSERVMARDDDGLIIPYGEKDAGIDVPLWRERLEKVAENVAEIGIDNAFRLRRELGILNLDRYGKDMLKNNVRLLDRDPEWMQQLRSGDITILASSARGDHNGAFDNLGELMLETGSEKAVICEINQPSDFYRHVIYLHDKYGVAASNLVVAAHGSPLGMDFEGRGGKFGTKKSTIARSSLGRFVGKYMVPGKESGERSIALLSCSQAAERPVSKLAQLRRRLFGGPIHEMSTAEVIAQQTSPADNVVVSAVARPFTLQYHDGDMVARERKTHKPIDITEFRRRRLGITTRKITNQFRLNRATEAEYERAA